MKSIKNLNEKLLWEVKYDKENKKEKSSLKSREYRDNYQNYKGRISGSSNIDIEYKDLKNKLEDKMPGINWTIINVKKTFEIITKMIGVQPEDE